MADNSPPSESNQNFEIAKVTLPVNLMTFVVPYLVMIFDLQVLNFYVWGMIFFGVISSILNLIWLFYPQKKSSLKELVLFLICFNLIYILILASITKIT